MPRNACRQSVLLSHVLVPVLGLAGMAGLAAGQTGAQLADSPPAASPPPMPVSAPPAITGPVTVDGSTAVRSEATMKGFRLDETGKLVPDAAASPVEGSDAAIIASARQALAEDRPGDAISILDDFIDRYERTSNPYLAQAYLYRGDAITADGNEYNALYDYETIIRGFAASPQFVTAIERELDIAVQYVNGLDRKWLGMRFVNAFEEGEELLVRVQERMPGSRLAERAGIELADHYYRQHELALAAEAYELFMQNFPNSAYRMKAMQRRIFANIARFKGPRYDGSSLVDASVLIRRFMSLYPSEAQQSGVDSALLTRIDESGGQQLLEVGNWYLRRNDQPSGRATLQRIVKLHPQTSAAQSALEILEARGWAIARSADQSAVPVGTSQRELDAAARERERGPKPKGPNRLARPESPTPETPPQPANAPEPPTAPLGGGNK